MKTNVLFLVLIFSFAGYASAAKKRRVIKTAQPASASKTSVKLDDVAQPKKRPQSQAFQAWLKDMKKRIQRSSVKSKQLVAVAAVRGDETPDAPPLYWKGKKSEGKVDAPEMKDFETAIETALSGEPTAAKEKLQSFLMAYPKSSMAADAQETLSRLEASDLNP